VLYQLSYVGAAYCNGNAGVCARAPCRPVAANTVAIAARASRVPARLACNGGFPAGVSVGVSTRSEDRDAEVERPRPASAGEARVELGAFRERSLRRGVNPLVYWPLRAILVPAFLIYLRMQRVGREHLPRSGPLLLAANHRSFLDPFVIGTLVRRPVYYMAKRELFEKRWQAWVLNSLGAFPVDRGAGDGDAMATAREILERGDCVVVFPEGTRIRTGPLARPHRGVGRLALETGVPVAPVALIGSDAVRRGWRIRPRRVRLRVGRPLRYPTVEGCSPALAGAVTERIWACVSLQWEWLGGELAPEHGAARDAPAREVSRAA
jgi:1-acyl-sn-glycerol-3-phosphate acyltransferase